MSKRTQVILVGSLIAITMIFVVTAAAASTIEVPIDTVYRGDPGELFHVATIPAVDGDECTAILEGRNNESIHSDSDILVGSIVFADVEDGAFSAAGLSFTATGPIPVAVRLGGDGVFSAGFFLEVTCEPTITTSTTSTTVGPSIAPIPTTTSTTLLTNPSVPTPTTPPPVGGVPAGGGSEASAYNWWPAIVLGTVVWLFVMVLGLAFVHGASRKDSN